MGADRISIASVNVDLINDLSYLCSMVGIRGAIQQTTKSGAKNICGRDTFSKGTWSFCIITLF